MCCLRISVVLVARIVRQLGRIVFTSQAAGNESGRRRNIFPSHQGFLQSSCLGPLLFTLNTADLLDYITHSSAHLCTFLLCDLSDGLSSQNVAIGVLNTHLESIRTWYTKHVLKLNTDNKCFVPYVVTPHELLNLKEENVPCTSCHFVGQPVGMACFHGLMDWFVKLSGLLVCFLTV